MAQAEVRAPASVANFALVACRCLVRLNSSVWLLLLLAAAAAAAAAAVATAATSDTLVGDAQLIGLRLMTSPSNLSALDDDYSYRSSSLQLLPVARDQSSQALRPAEQEPKFEPSSGRRAARVKLKRQQEAPTRIESNMSCLQIEAQNGHQISLETQAKEQIRTTNDQAQSSEQLASKRQKQDLNLVKFDEPSRSWLVLKTSDWDKKRNTILLTNHQNQQQQQRLPVMKSKRKQLEILNGNQTHLETRIIPSSRQVAIVSKYDSDNLDTHSNRPFNRRIRRHSAEMSPNSTPSIIRLVLGNQDTLAIPCGNFSVDVQQTETPSQVGVNGQTQPATKRRQPANKQTSGYSNRSHSGASWLSGSKSFTGGISLIVWHKDDDLDQPIFIADARGVESLGDAKQVISSNALKGRARLEDSSGQKRPTSQTTSPALVISQPSLLDSGLYTCTLEFHKAPTQIHQVRVELIRPPQNMVIKDDSGVLLSTQDVSSLAGPYDEGSHLVLSCQADSGVPNTGQISWWKLIDSPGPEIPPKEPISSDKTSIWNYGDFITTIGIPFSARAFNDDSRRAEVSDYFVSFHSNPPTSEPNNRASQIPNRYASQQTRYWTRIRGDRLEAPSDSSGQIQSSLEIVLNRANLDQEFLCLANNNQHSTPVNSSIRISLNLKPSQVKITNKSSYNFTLNQRLVVECEVHGSRPAPKIRWLRGNQEIELLDSDRSGSSHANNYASEIVRDKTGNSVTDESRISYLTFVPQLSDDKQNLVCSAKNPKMPSEPEMSDSIEMDVRYAPQLSLQLGPNLRSDSIRVGADIFMDCDIKANPPISSSDLNWFHNGDIIRENTTAGIRMSGQSLVMSHIGLEQRGLYYCEASNSVGHGSSNKIEIRPKFEPICDNSKTKAQIEVKLNKAVRIDCFIEADPSDDIHFEWKFNKSLHGELLSDFGSSHRLLEIKHYETNSTQSHIIFEPKSNRDFGQLICSGSNSIGRQSVPCLINVIPSAVPDPVFNCFSDSYSNSSFSVHCQPPAESGSSQLNGRLSYVLEFQPDENSLEPVTSSSNDSNNRPKQSATHLKQRDHSESYGHNGALDKEARHMTSDNPSFELDELQPDTRYKVVIYAQNSKGRSEPAFHLASTLPDIPNKSRDQSGRIQLNAVRPSNGQKSSLSEGLISFLKVSDYVDLGSHSKQLIEITLIVLLCSLIVGLLTFFSSQLCNRPASERKRRRSSARVSSSSSDAINKLATYDKRNPKLVSTVQLRPVDPKSLSGHPGSGSDTSRETNTESTLLSSSRTNATSTTETYALSNQDQSCHQASLTHRDSFVSLRGVNERRLATGNHPKFVEKHNDLYSALAQRNSSQFPPLESVDNKSGTPQVSIRSNSERASSQEFQDQVSLVCSPAEQNIATDQIYVISRPTGDQLNARQQGLKPQHRIQVMSPSPVFWSETGDLGQFENSFQLSDCHSPNQTHLNTCRLYSARDDDRLRMQQQQQQQFGCLPNSFSIPVSLAECGVNIPKTRPQSRQECLLLNQLPYYQSHSSSIDMLRLQDAGCSASLCNSDPMEPIGDRQTSDCVHTMDRNPAQILRHNFNPSESNLSQSDGSATGSGIKRQHVKFDT